MRSNNINNNGGLFHVNNTMIPGNQMGHQHHHMGMGQNMGQSMVPNNGMMNNTTNVGMVPREPRAGISTGVVEVDSNKRYAGRLKFFD
jgi:hypothetical protein